MPIPTISDPPQPPGKPSQKSMTKAERRELQEKQRAAKQQQQQQGKQAPGKQAQQNPPPSAGPSTQSKGKPSHPPRKSVSEGTGSKQHVAAPKESGPGHALEDVVGKPVSHGLRIFAHFGQPKPIAHTIKGDIHPAIIRLGLLFSEFKICGANARCIATLTAFKKVFCCIAL